MSAPDNAEPAPALAPRPQAAPSDAEPSLRLPRERVVLLFVVMLVTAAGNTAMQSVMPSIGTRLNVPDFWMSLAYSGSALLWMTMAPFWAWRSDRRGRKTMMAVGLVGFVASFALCGLVLIAGLAGLMGTTATLLVFAAARSLYGGFGSAAPPAVQAYVASRTSRAERTQALSLITSSFGLGTVLGPALAPFLILPHVGLASPFFFFALFGVVVLVVLHLRLPDDDPHYGARGQVMTEPLSASSNPARVSDNPDGVSQGIEPARLRWGDERLRRWLVTGLLGGVAQAMLLGTIGFVLLDRLGLRSNPEAGAGAVGLVMMIGAAATLVAQWSLIPLLHLGPRPAILWGMVAAAAGTVVVALGRDLHTLAVGFAVASLGFGLFRPGFTAGASLAVSRAEQGQVAGIVASLNGAPYIVAPTFGVWLYNRSPWGTWLVIEAFTIAVVVVAALSIRPDPAIEPN